MPLIKWFWCLLVCTCDVCKRPIDRGREQWTHVGASDYHTDCYFAMLKEYDDARQRTFGC